MSNNRQTEDPILETKNIEVSCVNMNEMKKALKGMSKGKAKGVDDLSIDIIRDAGDFLQYKLAVLFTKCS